MLRKILIALGLVALYWIRLFKRLLDADLQQNSNTGKGLGFVTQQGWQPLAQLKADALPREVMESVLRDRFATWHGISSILYLVQSLLGLCLVVWSARGLK